MGKTVIMKNYFERLVQDAPQIQGDGDLRLHVVSTVRLLLQQAVYGLMEWASKQPKDHGHLAPANIFRDLLCPSDGTLLDSLETIVIYCEQLGWSGISRATFEALPPDAACRQICNEGDMTVSGLLRGLIRLRNEGAEGHGLPGNYDRNAELDCLGRVLDAVKPMLPFTRDNRLFVGPEGKESELSFLRLIDGHPILIRKIRVVSQRLLRVEAQHLDRHGRKATSRFEVEDRFSQLNSLVRPTLTAWSNSWKPLCYLPDRTTDSFKGRDDEQSSLVDWMNDEESRACLVFGDGGVGKTTLVVELLHRLLEEDDDLKIEWRPKIISFYTAKKWRWGLNGIELLSPGQPHLIGLLAHLHLLLFGELPPEDFYRLDAPKAAIRIQQLMKDELGVIRSDHLIIIDNSETLVSSDRDIEQLGKELKEISRRVGRVIITSRRREVLEAAPIAVAPLKPLDAISLIKERGGVLNLKAIRRAKDGDLLDLVNKLECRPLVLEAFLQALASNPAETIATAKVRVSAMLRRDLGEFLFADAWSRFSNDIKRLLLLLTQFGDVVDARQLTICSEMIGVPIQAAEEALEESSGIASIVRMDSSIEVSFSANFIDFAKDKFVMVGGQKSPNSKEIAFAREKYNSYVRAVRSFPGDRIASAFRTPLAKAAYQARKNGELEEALRLYQQAILADSSNGWLFDRFAYFLFHDLRDAKAALIQAKRATELLANEGEVWFTRGIVESRLGMFRNCEASLERAQSLGVDKVRCGIQLCWAYLKAKPAMLNLASKQLDFLRASELVPAKPGRNTAEIGALMSRLEYLREKGRFTRG